MVMEEYKKLIEKAFQSMDVWKVAEQVCPETLHNFAKMCYPDFDDEEPEPLAVTNDLPVPAKTKQVQLLSPQKEELSR